MTATLKHYFVVCFGLKLSFICAAISLANEAMELDNRMLSFNALSRQNLAHKGRPLVHLVHLRNLVIDSVYYPVIDIKKSM